MTDLKPCHYCGDPDVHLTMPTASLSFAVACPDCGASGPSVTFLWDEDVAKESAIAHWNDLPRREDMLAEVLRLRAKLVEEREARLWDAYGTGHERDGEWEHSYMADAIWLLRECGIDLIPRWRNAAMIREAIPEAAKRVLTEG